MPTISLKRKVLPAASLEVLFVTQSFSEENDDLVGMTVWKFLAFCGWDGCLTRNWNGVMVVISNILRFTHIGKILWGAVEKSKAFGRPQQSRRMSCVHIWISMFWMIQVYRPLQERITATVYWTISLFSNIEIHSWRECHWYQDTRFLHVKHQTYGKKFDGLNILKLWSQVGGHGYSAVEENQTQESKKEKQWSSQTIERNFGTGTWSLYISHFAPWHILTGCSSGSSACVESCLSQSLIYNLLTDQARTTNLVWVVQTSCEELIGQVVSLIYLSVIITKCDVWFLCHLPGKWCVFQQLGQNILVIARYELAFQREFSLLLSSSSFFEVHAFVWAVFPKSYVER